MLSSLLHGLGDAVAHISRSSMVTLHTLLDKSLGLGWLKGLVC